MNQTQEQGLRSLLVLISLGLATSGYVGFGVESGYGLLAMAIGSTVGAWNTWKAVYNFFRPAVKKK